MSPDNKKDTQAANLGFEAKLFLAADKLRGSMDASEYKHVALGLVFLKYISDAFSTVYEKLKADEYADEEDPEEYLAERTFWVQKEARWAHLQANAKQPTIGKLVDDAMLAIEKSNTMKSYWIPGVNNLKKFGRWDFAEFQGNFFQGKANLQESVDKLMTQYAAKNN